MSTIKNILAVMPDAESGRATLQTAVRLARQLHSNVDALHVKTDPATTLPLVGEAMSGVMVDEMMLVAERESLQRAEQTQAEFNAIISRESVVEVSGPVSRTGSSSDGSVTAAWLEDNGVEEQVVALRGCRADLIVVARPTTDNETSALITLNAALMQSGRPVVAAPPIADENQKVSAPIRKVAVFWNGSAEATRTVAASLPFLKSATEVAVLRVEEEEWYASVEDLEAFLGWHEVKTVISKVLPREVRTGRSLLYAARDSDADMMVMGAYTRSKLRQLMLGSVTGYVMEHAILPVLMCH